MEKACRKDRFITTGDTCPIDGGTDLTKNWEGYILLIDPEKSEIAKVLGASAPGKYALKLK
ncbi:MAG TPA: transcription elongation factor subunit Spt4 [Candidatus Norongarragalinales archaeon]|jgi:DNA-directed RNA polymerase subunit E"|nr:transcription elongation factor subunit Spt4 [Candidatus Norongarragalinales archaeon]